MGWHMNNLRSRDWRWRTRNTRRDMIRARRRNSCTPWDPRRAHHCRYRRIFRQCISPDRQDQRRMRCCTRRNALRYPRRVRICHRIGSRQIGIRGQTGQTWTILSPHRLHRIRRLDWTSIRRRRAPNRSTRSNFGLGFLVDRAPSARCGRHPVREKRS